MTSRLHAREMPAGTSPIEYCVLKEGLVLRAVYGPLAPTSEQEPAGMDDSFTWGSATCKGVLGTARYRAWPQDERRALTSRRAGNRTVEPPTDAELADMTRFAQASAARHGCSAPVLPRTDDT